MNLVLKDRSHRCTARVEARIPDEGWNTGTLDQDRRRRGRDRRRTRRWRPRNRSDRRTVPRDLRKHRSRICT